MSTTSYDILARSHPCYDMKAHNKIGRIHLPVVPKCNIGCRFCDRKVSSYFHTSRPGLAYTLMHPGDAASAVKTALEKDPSIEVVGISGPGEPLFNKETFETLEIISKNYPFLKLCVCTNGLLLFEKAQVLRKLNVKTLTVTINAVSPKIASKISSFSFIDGVKVNGIKGAEILVSRQLEGLELASKLGFLIKINTVLIPGINLAHVRDIAYEVQRRGAYILNIMPLIPLGEFRNLRAPTCNELIAARESCESIIPIFRACKQCRADACGIPGLEGKREIPNTHSSSKNHFQKGRA
ncbi:MAG: radical SAM protein [Methanomassiliicoccales archaeon]|nr:MAG: radical SAM protein [Methanomassiliicoccales archaeon]